MRVEAKRAQERFIAEMSHFDDAVLVLLKGHLLIEEALTDIIQLHVFHPEHLERARLTFHHKVCIVRALALRMAQVGEWELIQAINSLRNELAHQLQSEERDKKMLRLRELYRREAADMDGVDESADGDEKTMVASACALVLGVLSGIHADSNALRGWIYTLDRTMNPDLLPFERSAGLKVESESKKAR